MKNSAKILLLFLAIILTAQCGDLFTTKSENYDVYVPLYEDDTDNDSDGFGSNIDCDDNDEYITLECYDLSDCEEDNDDDGFNTCIDCDDSRASYSDECYDDVEVCRYDDDGDGFNYCIDCDDSDDMITDDCLSDDEIYTDSETGGCLEDEECQDILADELLVPDEIRDVTSCNNETGDCDTACVITSIPDLCEALFYYEGFPCTDGICTFAIE